jgi:hypothetical protein
MPAEHEFWLSRNLKETLALPDDARSWLLSLWNVIQVFDDMADGDFPDRDKLDVAIFDAIVGMPANPFFNQHKAALLPLLAVAVLKWKASDTAERAGQASPMSYAWRAGFYDIVLAVVQIAHGTENAMQIGQSVMALYGEGLPEYLKEFGNA